MEFLQGNVFFFIIAIGECANYLSDTDTVSVSLRDRAILGGFVTPGSMCGLDLSWARTELWNFCPQVQGMLWCCAARCLQPVFGNNAFALNEFSLRPTGSSVLSKQTKKTNSGFHSAEDHLNSCVNFQPNRFKCGEG